MSHCDSAPAAKRPKTSTEYFSIEVKGHGSKLLLNMNRGQLNYCSVYHRSFRMSDWSSPPAAKKLKASASEYFTIEAKNHGSNLLHNLNRARLEERFCDFKIQVGTQTIHAHKIVLAEGSDYFRAMLSHSMKESIEGIVEMVDVDFECLKICVEYIYLGKITVVEEKVQSLLEVAHRLQLNELYEEVVKSVGNGLTIETLFTAKGVASSLDLRQLGEKCDDFALKNLSGIALQEDFVNIDSKYLEFLMTAEDSAAVKCKTFLIWANHDPESRGGKFEDFFLNLELDELIPSYINFMQQNEPLFYNSDKCLKKVTAPDLPTRICQDIDLKGIWEKKKFGGFAVFDRISEAIHAYDPGQDTWTELHKLTPEISELEAFTAIAVGKDIFVFAPDQRNWKLRYSDKNSKWSAIPNRSVTEYVEAVEVDGQIYAFDESDEDSEAVELYDGSKWSHVTDKPRKQYESFIVAVDDSIYCIGGESYSSTHPHCNKYETRIKRWSSLPSMPEGRRCGSAAALDRKIYVIGGRDKFGVDLHSCLDFDIETEVWTKVESLENSRYELRAVPIAGRIYAIGGAKSDNTVEEFDPSYDEWETLMTLSGKEIVTTASVAL